MPRRVLVFWKSFWTILRHEQSTSKKISVPSVFSVVKHVMHKFFLYCLLLLFSFPLSAEDWYRVEVVLFAYLEPDADDEWWYEAPGLPPRTQTISLLTETADPVAGDTPDPAQQERLIPYLALPRQEYRLGGVRQTLALSRGYRPLLHVAWQQPGLGSEDVRAVRLNNLRHTPPPAQQAPQEAEPEAMAAPQYTPPVQNFTGHVRLRSSRFLHLDVDIAYFPDALEQPTIDAPARRASAHYVRLTESRRIKLEQLHYFDHPLFGLIVRVSRQLSAGDID